MLESIVANGIMKGKHNCQKIKKKTKKDVDALRKRLGVGSQKPEKL